MQQVNSLDGRRKEDETSLQKRVAAYSSNHDAHPLVRAVLNNTNLFQKLLFKLNSDNR